ncbi:MAG: DUF4062 domain-containing protein [Lentisphaerae bacterium]|nr:DUF4062 domain-containing protein [Lentisphaerota bacterium]
MVSSTVYGIEELLEQVFAILNGLGYEVWMSHKGTVPVFPNMTAFESCLLAVERCDLFLGIITTHYGSGQVDGGLSITHQELMRAIQLNKPRWILAHDQVPFARSLLRGLGYTSKAKRNDLTLKRTSVIDDLRVIDMYESAARHDLEVYQDRRGNWVQKFTSPEDAKLFATAQFSRYGDVQQFLREHFEDVSAVRDQARGGRQQ